MFVYQPTLNLLELNSDKSYEYVISWKTKGLNNFELIALVETFLLKIKCFVNRVGTQFNNPPLVVAENNNTTKMGNIYIVYDLDNW